MFSFTGSRGSFRGDTNFYGKQVPGRLLPVLFRENLNVFSTGRPILHADEDNHAVVAIRRRHLHKSSYCHANDEVATAARRGLHRF